MTETNQLSYEARRKILEDAIAHFGFDAQILKFVEECTEAATAGMHWRTGRCETNVLGSELADIMIMANQVAMIIGVDLPPFIDAKLIRLERRIAMEQANGDPTGTQSVDR